MHGITPAKRRELATVLGINPDHLISLSLAADYATVLVAKLDSGGAPMMQDGALVVETLSGPVLADDVEEV